MRTFTYIIKEETGIHARPAGLLTKEARKYESKITVHANGKSADATKLMALMTLGVKCADAVEVTVEGSDEERAYEGLQVFFEQNL